MDWNFDISQAPRGRMIQKEVKTPKGGTALRDVFLPDRIIVASQDGETVTVSHWIPPTKRSAGRWNLLGSSETPLAWMPFPEHPGNR